ncbi:hypothetical protein ABL78_3592 [Leptomonas seymouri]|uniref:Uncharacterized protein n=1 Tax=Leptomonas seymouri TaxID=5684 RepID=A0A0N0P679_LEPSE|nr:hypothetical protein ABL78_3592 [Leptomonas seymouri]|eukprot:KPI87309.1 hypothetical protein ABL78_3592 [Leptomonas seymouri]
MVGSHASPRGGTAAPPRSAASCSSNRTAALTNVTHGRGNNNRIVGTRGVGGAKASASPPGQTRLTAPLRGRWTAEAIAPELHGRRAAAWIAVWDIGSVARRVNFLETLKALHSDSNSNALEEDLGDAAPLLFARLTSWWKLRYGTWAMEVSSAAKATAAASLKSSTEKSDPAVAATSGSSTIAAAKVTDEATAAAVPSSPPPSTSSSEVLVQVEAITVFVRGSRYLLQFVEGGGAAALCDCLEVISSIASSPSLPTGPSAAAAGSSDAVDVMKGYVRERRAITLLLLHIANSGRVYREMVGDEENLLHILHALLRETDTTVANPITELLAVLGKGHPQLSTTVQAGLFRVLGAALLPHEDAKKSTRAAGAATEATGQPSPSSQFTSLTPSSEHSTSEVVVLSTARAIRALQLQAEQQHYRQFPAASTGGGVGGGRSSVVESMLTNTASSVAGMIDYVPIVGLDNTVTANSFAAVNATGVDLSRNPSLDPLLRPFTVAEFLDTLFLLALDERHTAYRVEGNELLNLAAKNIHLTPKILTRCLDVVDDDAHTLECGGEGEGEREGVDSGISLSRLRRQRRQLSCGRAAVLILISRPMTSGRRDLLLNLVAQRGGNLTLLKYLRLTQHGDTAAVVDCCHALQFIARASMELQRRRLGQQRKSSVSSPLNEQRQSKTSEAVLLRMTEGIQSALGEATFQLLLFQELSEDDCMAILRSARAVVVRTE